MRKGPHHGPSNIPPSTHPKGEGRVGEFIGPIAGIGTLYGVLSVRAIGGKVGLRSPGRLLSGNALFKCPIA